MSEGGDRVSKEPDSVQVVTPSGKRAPFPEMRGRPRALTHCGTSEPWAWSGEASYFPPEHLLEVRDLIEGATSSQQREEFLVLPGVKVRTLKTEGTTSRVTVGAAQNRSSAVSLGIPQAALAR